MNCQTKFTLFFEDWCFSNQGPLKLLYIHWLKLEKLSLQTLPVPWTTVDALLVPPGICCSHTAVIPMALGRWTSMLPSEDNGGAWRNCSSSASLVPAASVSWVIEVFRPTATLPLGKSQSCEAGRSLLFRRAALSGCIYCISDRACYRFRRGLPPAATGPGGTAEISEVILQWYLFAQTISQAMYQSLE